MKKGSFIKRSIAIVLCLSLIIINTNITSVKANSTAATSDTSSNYRTVFNEDVASNPEVSRIDQLAKEYFNEFKENGITKDTITNMMKTNSSKLSNPVTLLHHNEMMTSLGTTTSTSEYSSIIQQVTGYIYTFEQIAAQLASISIFMQLSYVLPFLDLVSLLAGAMIIVIAIAIVYTVVAVGVNDLILTWYVYSGSNLTLAKQNTDAIVIAYNNGALYWRAFLVDYYGLGGIFIGDPLTIYRAREIILLDTMYDNVFAMDISDAAILASSLAYTIFNGNFCNPEAHRGGGKILNMQHIHAIKNNGQRGNGHIFFAVPVYA